jgi:RNA 2',3'-cyclic 3'-phosphodiesterase
MPRIFTGLEIPAAVAEALAMLRGGLPGARWIDPEHYHLTLRFIGDVDDSTAHEVASLLGRIRRPALELRFDALSSFGGRRPRAVVATLAQTAALMELQAEHERLMQRIGLDPEGRKYTPHVTLARLRDASSRQVAEYLSTRVLVRPLPFTVSRFVLFSSRASVGGGPYIVEAAYPLAA